MVISQIAGLATAFGTGELSGAGFGPNYTILMKLGYEFFAPRILEEMEKNPNVFFQDTLWFQKFQKQLKLYSDRVMKETLDTLLSIPQETIDQIAKKFQEQGAGAIPGLTSAPNVPITASPALNQIITLTKVVEGLIKQIQNMNFTFNIVPQAFGATPPGGGTLLNTPPTTEIPTQFTQPTDTTGPIQELQTQQQILNGTGTYSEYRKEGGLLSKEQWDIAKHGAFVPAQTELQQFIANTIENVVGKFITGATSHRRASESTNKLLAKFNTIVSSLIRDMNTNRNNKPLLNALKGTFVKTIQRRADHLFTYSL